MRGDDVDGLVDRYRQVESAELRTTLWYDGDDYEVVYVREDVSEQYSPEEFEEKVKQLVVEGLGDPPTQEQFRLFGDVNVVIRRFDRGVMLHFPIDEFSGVAATFDDGEELSIDTLVEIGTEVLG